MAKITKDEFIRSIAEEVASESKEKRGVILITILLAVLGTAVSFITNKCLNNNFSAIQKIGTRRAIRLACKQEKVNELAAQLGLTGDDIYREYGNSLAEKVINKKLHLNSNEVKEMLGDIPVD